MLLELRKIIAIILIIFLPSCVFLTENSLEQNINANDFLNRFPENKKTIVILKMSGKKSDLIYLCPKENAERNIEANNIKNCQPIYATNQYNIVMLDPNLFYLLSTPENRPVFSSNKIEEKEKYLTILEAKPGEILYVGDLTYKKSINNDEDKKIKVLNQKFLISDNFELLESILSGKNHQQKEKLFANQPWQINYLIDQYPSLKNRFKKRLLKNFEFKNLNIKNQNIIQDA